MRSDRVLPVRIIVCLRVLRLRNAIIKEIMEKTIDFLKGVYEELSKVTWLNRQDVIKSTIAVTVVVILVSVYISLVDFGLSKIIGSLIGGR